VEAEGLIEDFGAIDIADWKQDELEFVVHM
jgi:hypothetical protein